MGQVGVPGRVQRAVEQRVDLILVPLEVARVELEALLGEPA
jgi:hypothetical protein